MYQNTLLWLLCAAMLSSQPAFAKAETDTLPAQKTVGLTLAKAIEKALAQSPRLKASHSGVAAAKGERQQAGAWANPELGIEAENVAGDREYKGFDSAELTYGIAQELPISGKLSAQEAIAGKRLLIATLDEQAAMLDVVHDVTVAYANAIAAEETVRLAGEQKALAEDVLTSVSIRVGAAAAPLIQQSRAEVERSTATIALDKATRERDIASRELAALMGDDRLDAMLDSTAFYNIAKPQPVMTQDGLSANPDLVKLSATLDQTKGRLDFEKASAIPDPRVNVGVRDFRDSGDQAFVVGLSLPIPVLDANRGNITKARHEVSRTEMDNQQALLNANADLMAAQERMENAYLQAHMLKDEVLPAADTAFRLSREGYGLGRFPYLEVLDAQRSLFVARQQHIEAITTFHAAKAQVERLTAHHLEAISHTGEDHAE